MRSDADLCQGTWSNRSQMVGRGAHTTYHPSIAQPDAGINRLVIKYTRWVVFGRGVERHGHSSSGNAAAATGGKKWRVKNGGYGNLNGAALLLPMRSGQVTWPDEGAWQVHNH